MFLKTQHFWIRGDSSVSEVLAEEWGSDAHRPWKKSGKVACTCQTDAERHRRMGPSGMLASHPRQISEFPGSGRDPITKDKVRFERWVSG